MTPTGIAASPNAIQDLLSIGQFSKSDNSKKYEEELNKWAGSNLERQGIKDEIMAQGGFRARLLQLEAPSTDVIEGLPFPPRLDTLAVDHPSENISDIHDVLEQIFTDILKSVQPGHVVVIECHFNDATDLALLQSVLSKLIGSLAAHHREQLPVTAKVAGDDVFRSGNTARSDSVRSSAARSDYASASASRATPPAAPSSAPPSVSPTTLPASRTASETVVTEANQQAAASDVAANAAQTSANNPKPKMAYSDEINQAIAAHIKEYGALKIGGREVNMSCPVSLDDYDSENLDTEWGFLKTGESPSVYSLVSGEALTTMLANRNNHPLLVGTPLTAEHIVRGRAALELIAKATTDAQVAKADQAAQAVNAAATATTAVI